MRTYLREQSCPFDARALTAPARPQPLSWRCTDMARPSKYDPAMCEVVIECGKQGMTVAEMAAELDICRDTFNEWRNEKKEFSDAVKRGLGFAQAWWEQRGRQHTFKQDGFNATSYIFQMKNRFRDEWSDRKEMDLNAKVTVKGIEMSFVGTNPKATDR